MPTRKVSKHTLIHCGIGMTRGFKYWHCFKCGEVFDPLPSSAAKHGSEGKMPEETPKPQTPTAIDGPIPDWQRQLTKSVAARRGLRLDVANAKELYRHLFTAESFAASRGPQNEKCDYRHTNRVQPMRCEYRKGHTGHHSLVNDYEQPDNEECDHGHRLYEGIGCRKCFHNALKGAMEQAERGCAAHIEAGAPFSPCPSIHHCFVCEALRKIKMASSKCVCGHDEPTHRVQVGSAPDKILKGCYICVDCTEFKANASRGPEETPSCPLCGSVEALREELAGVREELERTKAELEELKERLK